MPRVPVSICLLLVLLSRGTTEVTPVPASEAITTTVGPEAASAPVDPIRHQAPELQPDQTAVDSAPMLHACWSPEQLAGAPGDKAIQSRLEPDRTPPPDWAIEAAGSALPPLAQALRGSIRQVEPTDPDARLVALTFDLCEQANERAGYDADLVETLRRARVKATFFAGGKWMRTHPEQTMQLMADPLFEVGNHAWTHGNLRVIQGAEAREQILWTQAEYQVLRRELGERPCAQAAGPEAWERIPEWPRVFRFPYGTCNQGSLDLAAELGLPAVQWTVVTGDPDKGRSPQAIASTVIAGVKRGRGTIVVAHANGRGWNTAKSLPLFIPPLLEQGYRFVTLSELLAAGRPVAAPECYELRPGDNRRYDARFGRGTGG
jgi:peptidoglycan/xylan/chitin deacetylase (PgdA/CDA1 family)